MQSKNENNIKTAVESFFSAAPGTLPIYITLEKYFLKNFPGIRIRVSKTQISFSNRFGFAFVSLPRRKTKSPDVYIILSLGLGRTPDNSRIFETANPYPGRYTHHIKISSDCGIDGEIIALIKEAYIFALTK